MAFTSERAWQEYTEDRCDYLRILRSTERRQAERREQAQAFFVNERRQTERRAQPVPELADAERGMVDVWTVQGRVI